MRHTRRVIALSSKKVNRQLTIQDGPKSKPLPNYYKTRIKSY